ncbi:hypothetical protein B566_EDAN014522 [Ephemera danica]|nr:hypothetical protein B566_EDAN014522 [Ephemera danica]
MQLRRPWLIMSLLVMVCLLPRPTTAANPLSWLLRSLTQGRHPSLVFRELFVEVISRIGTIPRGFRTFDRERLQEVRPPGEAFPCRLDEAGPSKPPPTSVHRLRPADIRVVAAMGDSLTAGNGALATGLFQVFAENRGVVWSIGGEGDWRTSLTLPNILKEFRRGDLVGASTGDGLSHSYESQFNVADPNAFATDMLYMARVLVTRIRADRRVNFRNDWKLVTILVGSNDLCNQMCHEGDEAPSIWERHTTGLRDALDYLQKKLPRTLVNLVVTPDVTRVLARRGLSATCRGVNYLECPCLLSPSRALPAVLAEETVRRVQQAEVDLVASGRYDVTEDFTVVVQPFSSNVSFPIRPEDGSTDLSYLSTDCFHFSQKGYAWASMLHAKWLREVFSWYANDDIKMNVTAANALWNNMLEPVGNKTERVFQDAFTRFLCPSPERPFIFTSRNSAGVTLGATSTVRRSSH